MEEVEGVNTSTPRMDEEVREEEGGEKATSSHQTIGEGAEADEEEVGEEEEWEGV